MRLLYGEAEADGLSVPDVPHGGAAFAVGSVAAAAGIVDAGAQVAGVLLAQILQRTVRSRRRHHDAQEEDEEEKPAATSTHHVRRGRLR